MGEKVLLILADGMRRHGISANVYTPQARPINGICEQPAVEWEGTSLL